MVHVRTAELKKGRLALVLNEGTIEFVNGKATISEDLWAAIPEKFKGPGRGINIDPSGGKQETDTAKPIRKPRSKAA